MSMRLKYLSLLLVLGFLVPAGISSGLMILEPKGVWPDSWPKQLEVFRNQARTMDFGTAVDWIQYDIAFTTREEFETAWPALLEVMSEGAPIVLKDAILFRAAEEGQLFPDEGEKKVVQPSVGGALTLQGPGLTQEGPLRLWAGVRILSTPRGKDELVGKLREKAKRDGIPLPAYYEGLMGEDGKFAYVPATGEEEIRGFRIRVRTELVLYVDGDIVDVERLAMPKGSKVIDQRLDAYVEPVAEAKE